MKFHHWMVEFQGKGGKRIGVECKKVDAPRLTSSIRVAMEDLELEELVVIYPGRKQYPLAENIRAVPLGELAV